MLLQDEASKSPAEADKLLAIGMDLPARFWLICSSSPASFMSSELVLLMLQDEASERPFETVEPLADDLQMQPVVQGVRMLRPGGVPAFDNYFEARQHEVTFIDTSSCDVPCPGISQMTRTNGTSQTVRRATALL